MNGTLSHECRNIRQLKVTRVLSLSFTIKFVWCHHRQSQHWAGGGQRASPGVSKWSRRTFTSDTREQGSPGRGIHPEARDTEPRMVPMVRLAPWMVAHCHLWEVCKTVKHFGWKHITLLWCDNNWASSIHWYKLWDAVKELKKVSVSSKTNLCYTKSSKASTAPQIILRSDSMRVSECCEKVSNVTDPSHHSVFPSPNHPVWVNGLLCEDMNGKRGTCRAMKAHLLRTLCLL